MKRVAALVAASFVLCGCDPKPPPGCASLDDLATASLQTREGRLVEAALIDRIRAAKPFSCDVGEKPDLLLLDAAGELRLSVYVSGRFFVRGQYLDAWTASMRDKPYCCYRIGWADARALAALI